MFAVGRRKAGVAGVGIGRDLVKLEAVHRCEVDWIRELGIIFRPLLCLAHDIYAVFIPTSL
jgi:hypothetical protein